MITPNADGGPTVIKRAIQATGIVLFGLLIVSIGCRKKDNPITPDGPEPGEWMLVLHSPDTLYRNAPGGHVVNEVITVRLFDTTGAAASGVTVLAQCAVSLDSVSPNVTAVRDTVGTPWGCQPAMIYWGSGGVDGRDTITGWAVAHGDTVATAATSFKVLDPPTP